MMWVVRFFVFKTEQELFFCLAENSFFLGKSEKAEKKKDHASATAESSSVAISSTADTPLRTPWPAADVADAS